MASLVQVVCYHISHLCLFILLCWDSAYELELANYKSDGNIGDIWFGEESIDRVIQWMMESDVVNQQTSVIDVGSGNGAFLLCLAAEGFVNLLGIDYSENAVELARAIAQEKKFNVRYEVDLLSEDGGGLRDSEYDVCHDKGTYDAISLCPEDSHGKRLSYIKAIHRIIKENGLLIITSCNWTNDELMDHFEDYFSKEYIIPTPTFKFGVAGSGKPSGHAAPWIASPFSDNIFNSLEQEPFTSTTALPRRASLYRFPTVTGVCAIHLYFSGCLCPMI
nr:EEF1A lysine methyltransferase 2-like isoform X2 [Cherax quadricarinatus]